MPEQRRESSTQRIKNAAKQVYLDIMRGDDDNSAVDFHRVANQAVNEIKHGMRTKPTRSQMDDADRQMQAIRKFADGELKKASVAALKNTFSQMLDAFRQGQLDERAIHSELAKVAKRHPTARPTMEYYVDYRMRSMESERTGGKPPMEQVNPQFIASLITEDPDDTTYLWG